MKMDWQIISSIDGSSEILAQIQEIVIPIIVFTFENRLLGQFILSLRCFRFKLPLLADLFDNMYDLVDQFTYKHRAISPTMWPVFELTYKLFKHEAVDFLEGLSEVYTLFLISCLTGRNATFLGQLRLLWLGCYQDSSRLQTNAG